MPNFLSLPKRLNEHKPADPFTSSFLANRGGRSKTKLSMNLVRFSAQVETIMGFKITAAVELAALLPAALNKAFRNEPQ